MSQDEISWGEDDVRDAMSYFDLGACNHGNGIRGQRGLVVAFAYWTKGDHMGSVYDLGDEYHHLIFSDPIEAIQYARSLVQTKSGDER